MASFSDFRGTFRYSFGPFEVDPKEKSLFHAGQIVHLPPKAFDVLEILVKNAGHLVEKEDLLQAVWEGSFVEEGNLNNAIYVLRRALASLGGECPYIETVPRRGYRFVAVTKQLKENDPLVETAPNIGEPPPGLPASAAIGSLFPVRHWALCSAALAVVIFTMAAVHWLPRNRPAHQHALAASQATPVKAALPLPEAKTGLAQEAFLRGQFQWNKRSREGLKQAIHYFESTITADPNYAPAYAALADSYALSSYYGYDVVPSAEGYRRAGEMARKALELDSSNASAYATLGLVHSEYERRWDQAESAYRKAVALAPRNSLAQQRYGNFLLESGRLEEASMRIRTAVALDPMSPILNAATCNVAYFQQAYDEALKYCDRSLEIEPGQTYALILRAAALYQKRQFAEALGYLKRARQSAQGNLYFDTVEALGSTYYALGRYDAAEAALQELHSAAGKDHDILVNEAGLLATMGQQEQAFAVLQRASLTWPKPPCELLYDPVFSALREDPQFAEVVARRTVGPEPDMRVGGDWDVIPARHKAGYTATFR